MISLFFYNFDQCIFHVYTHRLFCTTDINVSTIFDPLKNLGCMLQKFVLHIQLFFLVPAESHVHFGKRTGLQPVLPFCLIQKISSKMLVTKNNQLRPSAPVASRSATKDRKGAIPVPGPIMIISLSAAGSLK